VSLSPRTGPSICHVLREDPDLAEAIEPELRDHALESCVARELRVATGPWLDRRFASLGGGIGLLVLEGLILHRVEIGGRSGAELLGEGDVLRPWEAESESTVPLRAYWSVLEPCRLAVLDERFTRQCANHPQLASRLFARTVQRSGNLAANMAIVHQARVDVRLHLLLWHLASRWGRVRTDGVTLPLRLTHAVLSDLVAARRPTVTSALSDLARRRLVRVLDDGWLLLGAPPGAQVHEPLARARAPRNAISATTLGHG
jgi:CRP/FNR family transcriptional regulator, cyclic AMP receptor protein